MREIITIHMGGGGCQIGDELWELYCKEHGIVSGEGTRDLNNTTPDFSSAESLFYETSEGRNCPLSIFFDNEPSVVDQSRKKFRKLMSNENMISGKEDAANNFSRGHYTIGKDNIHLLMERIKILSERCDSLQGINIVNSLGGGTGSGTGMLLLDRLVMDYPKVPIQLSTVVPSPTTSDTVVEPYNFCWSMQNLHEQDGVTTFYDNEALYDICSNHLGISDPNFSHINQIIAQHIATTFSSCRVGSKSTTSVTLADIHQSLIPIPRIHLLTPSFVPFGGSQTELGMADKGKLAYSPTNTLVSYNILEGRILSSLLQHRGNVSMRDNFECLSAIKKIEGMSLGPSWIPNTFNCHISKAPISIVDDSVFGIVPSEKTLAVTTNTTSVATKLKQIATKYDKLWEKRSFVHWYVGEGIDDDVCRYGRSVVEDCLQTYKEVVSQ